MVISSSESSHSLIVVNIFVSNLVFKSEGTLNVEFTLSTYYFSSVLPRWGPVRIQHTHYLLLLIPTPFSRSTRSVDASDFFALRLDSDFLSTGNFQFLTWNEHPFYTMQKIIKIGQCCAWKGPLQKTLAHYCMLKNVPKLKMVKWVPTCWNTMYIVVHHARHLRKALDAMCNGAPQNSDPIHTKYLRCFTLSSDEWGILEKLEPVLMVHCLFCLIIF